MRDGDAVDMWLEEYRPQLISFPAARKRITDTTWRMALGRLDRFSDWQAFFLNQLRELSWSEVLDRWTMRLAPGFSGADDERCLSS